MKTCSEALKVDDKVDEFQALGITFAAKIKKMNTQQQIKAELLINKIMAKGLLNKLTENTDIMENTYILNAQPSYSTYSGGYYPLPIPPVQDNVFFSDVPPLNQADDKSNI